jgi:hypothetical protein
MLALTIYLEHKLLYQKKTEEEEKKHLAKQIEKIHSFSYTYCFMRAQKH